MQILIEDFELSGGFYANVNFPYRRNSFQQWANSRIANGAQDFVFRTDLLLVNGSSKISDAEFRNLPSSSSGIENLLDNYERFCNETAATLGENYKPLFIAIPLYSNGVNSDMYSAQIVRNPFTKEYALEIVWGMAHTIARDNRDPEQKIRIPEGIIQGSESKLIEYLQTHSLTIDSERLRTSFINMLEREGKTFMKNEEREVVESEYGIEQKDVQIAVKNLQIDTVSQPLVFAGIKSLLRSKDIVNLNRERLVRIINGDTERFGYVEPNREFWILVVDLIRKIEKYHAFESYIPKFTVCKKDDGGLSMTVWDLIPHGYKSSYDFAFIVESINNNSLPSIKKMMLTKDLYLVEVVIQDRPFNVYFQESTGMYYERFNDVPGFSCDAEINAIRRIGE